MTLLADSAEDRTLASVYFHDFTLNNLIRAVLLVFGLSPFVINDGLHYAGLRIEQNVVQLLGNVVPCEMNRGSPPQIVMAFLCCGIP